MVPRASIFILIASCCAAATSCMDVCACPPTPASALVLGQVTDPTGASVSDAAVVAHSAAATGCYEAEVADLGLITTEADGSFRLGVLQGGEQDSICVFVFARPPIGMEGLKASETALGVLSLRYDPPHDSVRIDLRLRSP